MNRFAIAIVLAAASASHTYAARIGLFMDSSYVDVVTEGQNLRTDLVGLGHTVNDFAGVSGTNWSNAIADNDLLVIAELEHGNGLIDDLSADAQGAIASFIAGGGHMITIDSTDPSFDAQTVDLLNGLFGFSLIGQIGTAGGGTVSFLNDVAAAGTSFEGGPTLLPGSNKVDSVHTSSLPEGALNLYHDGANGTTVFCAPFGNGTITHLGFDWFEAPAPIEWTMVLDAALSHASAASIPVVPEPSNISLAALGILGLFVAARRRTA